MIGHQLSFVFDYNIYVSIGEFHDYKPITTNGKLNNIQYGICDWVCYYITHIKFIVPFNWHQDNCNQPYF